MAGREMLPEEYHTVIVEIEGCYYPLSVEKREEDGTVRLGSGCQDYWEVEALHGVPPALGPRHMTGFISFKKRSEALDFCHRREEGYRLPLQWGILTAQTELYPERNAWYHDEIIALVKETPQVYVSLSTVYGSVFPRGAHCFVSAPTIDEAWKRLYTSVCEHVAQRHTA